MDMLEYVNGVVHVDPDTDWSIDLARARAILARACRWLDDRYAVIRYRYTRHRQHDEHGQE